jgi:hypothetical protein
MRFFGKRLLPRQVLQARRDLGTLCLRFHQAHTPNLGI